MLAIPDGAEAIQGSKRDYAATWVAPEGYPWLRNCRVFTQNRSRAAPLRTPSHGAGSEGRRSGGYSLRPICVR